MNETRQLILDGIYARQVRLRNSAWHRIVDLLSRGVPMMQTSTVQDPKTWRPRTKIGPSCYMPHQGARECARRRRQMGLEA